MTTFAHRLRVRRVTVGMTQEQLARLTGVAEPSISMFETGRRKPRLCHLLTLCDALGCTPDDLLTDNPKTPPRRSQLAEKLLGDIVASGCHDAAMAIPTAYWLADQFLAWEDLTDEETENDSRATTCQGNQHCGGTDFPDPSVSPDGGLEAPNTGGDE